MAACSPRRAPSAAAPRPHALTCTAAPAQEVLQALLGRVPPRTAATLQGFARRALRERTYPGICAEDGCCVKGQARYWRRSGSAGSD